MGRSPANLWLGLRLCLIYIGIRSSSPQSLTPSVVPLPYLDWALLAFLGPSTTFSRRLLLSYPCICISFIYIFVYVTIPEFHRLLPLRRSGITRLLTHIGQNKYSSRCGQSLSLLVPEARMHIRYKFWIVRYEHLGFLERIFFPVHRSDHRRVRSKRRFVGSNPPCDPTPSHTSSLLQTFVVTNEIRNASLEPLSVMS